MDLNGASTNLKELQTQYEKCTKTYTFGNVSSLRLASKGTSTDLNGQHEWLENVQTVEEVLRFSWFRSVQNGPQQRLNKPQRLADAI